MHEEKETAVAEYCVPDAHDKVSHQLAGRDVLQNSFDQKDVTPWRLKVNAFLLGDKGAILHDGVDGTDVLADDA
jgi:hypothetical protein